MLRQKIGRRGVAAVELAILLPFLALILVLAIDWSRIFYYSVTIENCARNGAIYGVDPYSNVLSPYADVTAAAVADSPNLSPTPTVVSSAGVDAAGRDYVDCTVTYTFKTLTRVPPIPESNTLTRTVRVYKAAQTSK